MNVFVNDDGTLEDIKTVKETEPDHDQLEQRFSDEEDSAGKKTPRIPFPSTGIICQDYLYDINNPVICIYKYTFNMYQFIFFM